MKKQRGFTLISVVLILALIAFFSLLAMRLLPMYQEYYAVLQVMDGMEDELKNNKLTKQQVLELLKKRFNIGYIKVVDLKENVVIERGKNNVRVTRIIIDYEDRVPFIAQLSLVGNFHAEVDVEPKGK
jgi:Tfp pilus assembly major pilin PilA